MRPARQSRARRERAAPRPRRSQPDAIPRNDRRRVRHARADSSDPRRYETASEFLARASEAYGAYGLQTSKWYEWSVRVLGARLALRRGALDEAAATRGRDPRAGAPPFDALQATLIAAEAIVAAGRVDEAAQRLRQRRGRARSEDRARRMGRIPAPPRRAQREDRAAPPTRTTISRRARRSSICWESAIRRRSATSRSGVSLPKQGRARPPNAIWTRRSRSSSSSAPSATWRIRAKRSAAAHHGRLGRIRAVARRRRRCDRAADCGCGGAAGSAGARNGRRALRSRRRRQRRDLRRAAGRHAGRSRQQAATETPHARWHDRRRRAPRTDAAQFW